MTYINRTLSEVTVRTKRYYENGEIVPDDITFFLEELSSRKRTKKDIHEYARSFYEIGTGGLKFVDVLWYTIEEVSLRMSVAMFGREAERRVKNEEL